MLDKYVIVKYLRLSLDDGDKEESDSIGNQRNLLDYYIHQIFKDRNIEKIEIVDDGYSGTNMNRPGMKRLLILAETKQINCVIVKDFSRFARDYIEVGRYAEQKFPEWQIRFISVNDGYDSNDFRGMTGGIDMALKSIVYTMYSRDLSEKVKSARKILQKQGKYFAPYAFFGYNKSPDDKHKLIVDPCASEVVKRIFALRISGSSPAQIAYILNEDKVPTPSVYKKMNDPLTRDWNTVSEYCKWSLGTVGNILRDERYTGKLIAQKYERIAVGSSKVRAVASENRIVVPNTHESIISQKTYDEVQALSKRKKRSNTSKFSLASLVCCGGCKHKMSMSKTQIKDTSYWCDYKRFSANNDCFQGRIFEQDLVEILKTIIKTELEKTVDISKAQEKVDKLMNKNKKAVLMLQKSVNSEKKKKLTEYTKLTKNEITEDEFVKNRAEIDERIEALNDEIQSITYQKISDEDITVLNLFGKYIGVDNIDNDIIRDLVKAIYVYNDKRIEVVWNFRATFTP